MNKPFEPKTEFVKSIRFQHIYKWVVLSALFGSDLVMAQPNYTVTEISTLPGCNYTTAADINQLGEVAGSCSNTANNSTRGFVWRNGVATSTGLLPTGTYSNATAINDLGHFAGDGNTDNAAQLVWINRGNGLFNFFSNNGGFSRAIFLGNSGFIGGRYTKSKSGWVKSVKGVLWTPDPRDPSRYRKVDLPILPGGVDLKSSYALPESFNEAGVAVGWATTDQIGQRAVMWNNDANHTIVDLGVLIDGYFSAAYGVNDLGQVVGASIGYGTQPVIWDNDLSHSIRALPILPTDVGGEAIAINNDGQVIGRSFSQPEPGSNNIGRRPVIWVDDQIYSLQDAINAAGASQFTILEANAINDAGQIAATAARDGQTVAVVLSPTAL